MDVLEIKKLDAYLKKLFGNARIRVVPRPSKEDLAEVYMGEEKLGDLNLDDEDDDRSYNFRMEINLGETAAVDQIERLGTYLKRKFDNEKMRVMAAPKKAGFARSLSRR